MTEEIFEHNENYGARFVARCYGDLIKPAEFHFGLLSCLAFVLSLTGWMNNTVPFRGVMIMGAFILANITMTQVTLRCPEKHRITLEVVRIFGMNGLFAPLLYLKMGGPLAPCWIGYMIGVTGSAITLGAIYPTSSWVSRFGVLFWGLNLLIAATVGLAHPNYYQLALSVGSTLMTGFVFLRFTEKWTENARAENDHFQEAVKKLRMAQAQMIESGKLAALGQMAGGIAHEINSPLSTVHLAVGQIRRFAAAPEPDTKTILERAALIQTVVERIARIVTGLRSFCRHGASEPFQQANLANVISDTLTFCEERFRVSGVGLMVEGPLQGVELECQAVQLSQVLLNLLNNSYDAVQALQQKKVWLRVYDEDQNVKLVIEDSGARIPAAIEGRIFEPFFTTKNTAAGTGLGLSISKRIVEEHGGTISLDPFCPNTAFVIWLPKKQSRGERHIVGTRAASSKKEALQTLPM